MRKIFKKGGYSLSDLPNVALTFLLVGVFFAVALVILSNLQSNTAISPTTTNATLGQQQANIAVAKTITAVSEIPNNWLLLIAVIVAAAIIIGIVVSNLGGNMNSGRV